jgi:hypothetical protein
LTLPSHDAPPRRSSEDNFSGAARKSETGSRDGTVKRRSPSLYRRGGPLAAPGETPGPGLGNQFGMPAQERLPEESHGLGVIPDSVRGRAVQGETHRSGAPRRGGRGGGRLPPARPGSLGSIPRHPASVLGVRTSPAGFGEDELAPGNPVLYAHAENGRVSRF